MNEFSEMAKVVRVTRTLFIIYANSLLQARQLIVIKPYELLWGCLLGLRLADMRVLASQMTPTLSDRIEH